MSAEGDNERLTLLHPDGTRTAVEVIAEQYVIFVQPDGTRVPGAIRIGKPQLVDGTAARCAVAIPGLHESLPGTAGEGTLQALMLAGSLCHDLLTGFVERGGRILYADSDEDFALDATFGVEASRHT
ncbi:hypothetical protein JYT22_01070 [Endomicrobium sp. AH-315-J14]|nr:hypothetical protein [Endomicrobium sp. AH-315-J14]